MPTRDASQMFPRIRLVRGGAVTLVAAGLAACTMDPAAPLIPMPERQATVLPSEAARMTADGFPNVLADPVSVAGLPRPERTIAAEEAALEAERRRTQAATAGLGGPRFAGALARRGATHVEEARRAIEATGRPQVPGIQDAALDAVPAPAAADPPPEPSRPVDPAEPLPRAVGVPPFTGPSPSE